METAKLDETLEQCKSLGIRNLLSLRGGPSTVFVSRTDHSDPPRGEEYWVAADPEFQHAIDLVRYIRRKHGDYFCVGVAAYPEGHADSADKTSDVDHLRAKVDAGADFIVTQLFYDVERFLTWHAECQSKGTSTSARCS